MKEDSWVCYVTIGPHDTRRFVSNDVSSPHDTERGKKEGTASAARAALVSLKEEIAKQESKPKKQLAEVFPPGEFFQIKCSSPRNWEQFIWNNKPSQVGIDTEGNQSCPPLLVQIATDKCVILELTSMNDNQLSPDLKRLLSDETIVKVFCDNFSHRDKTSLGLAVDKENSDFAKGSIVDLEVVISKRLGPVKVARGLSRIVTLVMPELNVILQKPTPASGGRFKNIGRFTLIEQGELPPFKSLRDLSRKEQQYAALDAWAALRAYERIVNDDKK